MTTDLGIAVPPSWRRTSDPDRGVLVSARSATLPASGYRPDLVLRSGSSPPADLSGRLHDFALEDEDVLDLFGHEVRYLRFAHRVGAVDVLCDQ